MFLLAYQSSYYLQKHFNYGYPAIMQIQRLYTVYTKIHMMAPIGVNDMHTMHMVAKIVQIYVQLYLLV